MNPRRALAPFGEWIHHAAAITITAEAGGPALTAAYLAAYAVPAHLVRPPARARWLSPLAFAAVALLPPTAWALVVAGLVAGIGRAAARRPGAWLCGLEDSAGVPAVLGAAAGTALLTSSDELTMITAAVALALSSRGELASTAPSGPFAPAAAGACVVLGMRVLEPFLLLDPIGGAVFSLAWATGATFGARWGTRPDPRPVAAAPFLAAASIALMGSVEGPGTLLLWAAAAASVVMLLTAARRPGKSRGSLALAVTLAGAGTAAAGLFELLPSALWFAAVCLLLGGFISLAILARAKPAAPTAAAEQTTEVTVLEAEPASLAGPEPKGAPEPVPQAATAEAVAGSLLEAIRAARRIRTDAIAEARLMIDPFHDLKSRTAQAMTSLTDTIQEVKRKLAA